MKRSQISKQAWVLIAVSVVTAITSCTSSARLPSYVNKGSDGTVRIDVDEASGGSAELVEERSSSIVVQLDDYKTKFTPYAVSVNEGIVYKSLQDPPLRISPVITPGDDTADFFFAVWVDNGTQELHSTFFLDTDWQEVVEGPYSIHSIEWVPGSGMPRENAYSVDFSEAINDIYVRELTFQPENNPPGYNFFPMFFITNISGNPLGVLERLERFELEEQDVLVHITAQIIE